jgi:hypothetical protein
MEGGVKYSFPFPLAYFFCIRFVLVLVGLGFELSACKADALLLESLLQLDFFFFFCGIGA